MEKIKPYFKVDLPLFNNEGWDSSEGVADARLNVLRRHVI